ncbi:MAG: hypothetical protein HY908_04955 [Myxococcales bacterium]|nr:hypothetical protein [Myxococcales bacterium]
MVVRLLLGLLKGFAVGGVVGYLLGLAGMAVPPAWAAYLTAAAVGVVIALVAGKPIWQKGARIEVGMKAAAGAVLAPLMLLALRNWLNVGLPFTSLPGIPEIHAPEGMTPTIGNFAVTSLTLIAAVLGGFFDADNSDKGEPEAKPGDAKARLPEAAKATQDPLDFEPEEEPAERKARR